MSDHPLVRFRATLEYDGTDFKGFQFQPKLRTVQGELEQVLTRFTDQERVIVDAAGRTDAGVHATGQVISFLLKWRHDSNALTRAMNSLLPSDVAVRDVEAVDSTFHPRFSARSRMYRYYVEPRPSGIPRPSTRRYRWQVFDPIQLEPMQHIAAEILGEHNFSTFGTPPQGNNSVRTVHQANWQIEGEDLVFLIEANAFLYRMVRSLVGSMVQVGLGKWSIDDFKAAFNALDRAKCAEVAPPNGLFLTGVTYKSGLDSE